MGSLAGVRITRLPQLLLACSVFALAIGVVAADGASLPTAYTGEASGITVSSVTLKGSVSPSNQPTSYYFQYGPTSTYVAQTPLTLLGSDNQTVHVTALLGGLPAASIYHFRLVAVNPSGTVDGLDRMFTTRKIPLSFTLAAAPSRDVFASPFSVAGILSGTDSVDHTVVLQGNPFPYLSGFKDIAGPVLTDASGKFSFAMPGLLKSSQLRVSTLDTPPVHSRVMVELVEVRVALRVRGIGRRGFARLFGTVIPAQLGALVHLQLFRPHGTPVTVSSTIITGGTRTVSRFSRVVRVRRAGLYRAFVVVGGGKQVSGHSRAIRVG